MSSSLLECGHDEDRDDEVCSYCASDRKLQPALYFCFDCGVYGKFICGKCLKDHNKFVYNHEIEKIGNQSASRRTKDNDYKLIALQQSYEELQMGIDKLKEEKETLSEELRDCKVALGKANNVAPKTKELDCISGRKIKNRCIIKEKEDLKSGFILKSNYKPYMLVATIDIGITYTGWACSFQHEFKSDPTRITLSNCCGAPIVTNKVPTCVLIHPDGNTLHSFGYEAEDKFAELAEDNNQTQWFFFKHLKMNIDCGLGNDRTIMIMDVTGKQLKAKTVLALAIKYLKDDCITSLEKRFTCHFTEDDFRWVFTVPAIWNDAAKQFMIDVIVEAGISKNLQTIATEPVAASLYCRNLQADKFLSRHKTPFGISNVGKKFMVLDVGDETTQITVLELLSDMDLREIYAQCDVGIGGTTVDKAYEAFLSEIFGANVMAILKQRYQCDYIEMIRNFEIRKKNLSLTQKTKVTLRIPDKLFELSNHTNGRPLKEYIALSRYYNKIVLVSDKMRIESDVLKSFFDIPLRTIIDNMKAVLALPQVSGCSTILMVGGFSESPMLQGHTGEHFPDKNIIIPEDAGLAVLKGAVIFGHTIFK